MTALWRAHLFAGHGVEGRDYCLDNNLVALGWEAMEINGTKIYTNLVDDVKSYKDKVHELWGKNPKPINAIIKMEQGDLVWTHDKSGGYCIGMISDNEAHIPTDPSDQKHEYFGIYRNVEKWYFCENYEVPGKVMSCLIKGSSLQRIREDSLIPYCKALYEAKASGRKSILNMENNNDLLKTLLHYDDLEDLLGLWLQVEHYYLVFPSTNKTGTKDYEYMLVKKNGSRKAIIQCKIGSSNIEANTFTTYYNNGFDIYLTVLNGSVENLPANTIKINECKTTLSCNNNYYEVDADYLLKWASKHKEILPDRIQNFMKIAGY